MGYYILRRLVHALFVFVGISLIVFVALRLTGDPVAMLMQAGSPKQSDIEELRRVLDLDKPIYVQFGLFVWKALHGDFGRSLRYSTPALDLVLERLPATILLAVAAMVVAIAVAFPIGILSAVRRGGLIDFVARIISLIGVSFPNFWLGMMLILLFAVTLKWLPVSGYGTPQHVVLPAVALGLALAATIMRLLRSSLLDVLNADYIRTARAKGLQERATLVGHALKNALIPVVTIMGLQFGTLLGGAVIVETVFSWPGLGRLAVDSIGFRDYPVVQVSVLLLAATLVAVNLLVDLLYTLIDPRISYT